MLRRMAETGTIGFTRTGAAVTGVGADNGASDTLFDQFGPHIRFSATKKAPGVEELQTLLNTFPGVFVKVDGVAGQKTSDAFKKVTGHFLFGDPRGGRAQS
jgi:hypothetical protein